MSQTLAWMWLPSPGLEPSETGTVCPGHSSRTSGLPEALSLGPLQVICRQQPRAKQVKTSARPLSTVQPTRQTPTMRRSLSTGPTTGPPKVPPPSTREPGPEPCYLHQGHRGLGQTVATPSHNNAFISKHVLRAVMGLQERLESKLEQVLALVDKTQVPTGEGGEVQKVES